MPSANLYFATSLVSATHCAPETTPIGLLLMTHLSGADLQFSVPIFSSYLTSQQWWVQSIPLACVSGCLLCLLYPPPFILTLWLPSLRIFYRLFFNASSIHVFPALCWVSFFLLILPPLTASMSTMKGHLCADGSRICISSSPSRQCL